MCSEFYNVILFICVLVVSCLGICFLFCIILEFSAMPFTLSLQNNEYRWERHCFNLGSEDALRHEIEFLRKEISCLHDVSRKDKSLLVSQSLEIANLKATPG